MRYAYNRETNRFESNVKEPLWRKLLRRLGLVEDRKQFKHTDRVELHDWQKAELGEEAYLMNAGRFEKEIGK